MIKKLILKYLKKLLFELSKQERDRTKGKYNRINPFYEDIIDWKERGEFVAGKNTNVTIYNSTTVVGDVKIGENTWIGPFCSLDGYGGLEIGSNCSISLGTQILTHDSVKWALSGGIEEYEYANTKIGNNCFLGSYCVVVKGISIGDRCLVGAGAIVTKSFDDNSIIAGVPAKKIGEVLVSEDGKIEYKYFKDNKNAE